MDHKLFCQLLSIYLATDEESLLLILAQKSNATQQHSYKHCKYQVWENLRAAPWVCKWLKVHVLDCVRSVVKTH